jgi:hypothetical protein
MTTSQVDDFQRLHQEAPTITEIPSVVGVVQLLERAKSNGLKFPKLWLQLGNPEIRHELRITVAGENAKNPGHLTLTNGERYGSPDNKYYGRISPEGKLTIGRDGEYWRVALIDLLTRLAEDPAKVASEFGHLTGHCCFCSLQLTDERSTAVGYGKRCAEKFGLPWGETP